MVIRFLLILAIFLSMFVAAQAQSDETVVRVGSKGFTESVVLGELISHLARDAGNKAEHRAELGGTQVLWNALVDGDLDVYVDYTGTIRDELLAKVISQGTSVHSESDMRDELAKQGIHMSDRLGFNNTYALGMREKLAESLKIKKISDLRDHPELQFAFSDEFMERRDGYRPLAKLYRLPQESVRTMDHNLAYRGLEHNAIQVTDLYTTDAEIQFYNLRLLEDDKGYFPTYYAVLLMRKDLEQRAPKAWKSILRLENAIEPNQMIAMTAKVRLDRQAEMNVAADFLNENLGLKIVVDKPSELVLIGKRLFKTTTEHLLLVVISLTLAILTSVPLGILAARNENMGQAILAIVGVIQTLPSMALLVFMIPLFTVLGFGGLGPAPAIAALFFYSLLPIVRNTYTGLTQIPQSIKESAMVLGLGERARLKLVELPLALPSILAGIKTAAVINVGTATIGALIGAGGYGAPILTGIRLFHISLLLQGAIPAAILALLVQFGFGVLEKRFVSPGLINNR
jgi:osmoprotectant transport system permease protein